MTGGETIDVADLPRRRAVSVSAAGRRRGVGVAAMDADAAKVGTLREFKDNAERAYLVSKLRENGWNISKTAEVIDTPRSNLYKKLEQYQISPGNRRLTVVDAIAAAVRAPPGVKSIRRSEPDDRPPERRRREGGRKVRTPEGSAPGNARSG